MIEEKIIQSVREKNPLIHHLINEVVMNFVANGTLAFGASPVMAKAVEEAADMAKNADAVYLNIGTVKKEDIPAMIAAGNTGNEKGIPVLLDPVGVAATPFRVEAVAQILEDVKPDVIKGNASEIAYLAGIVWEIKGVDSVGNGNVEEAAKIVAEKFDTAVVVTGKTDVIYADGEIQKNSFGHPYLTQVTGGGCLLGSIIASCLTSVAPLKSQLKTAVEFYGRAAEYAAAQPHVKGPGTFMSTFVDALSLDVAMIKGADYNESKNKTKKILCDGQSRL